MKCPYCKGKNLYLKRTSPVVKYGCRDCEKKVKYLRECGLTDKQIEKVLKGGVDNA
jgi:transposase-like protein